jgi:hypothetical protein
MGGRPRRPAATSSLRNVDFTLPPAAELQPKTRLPWLAALE